MARKTNSTVEELFNHFKEIMASEIAASKDNGASMIAASILTLAAVAQNGPAGRSDVLQTVLKTALGNVQETR